MTEKPKVEIRSDNSGAEYAPKEAVDRLNKYMFAVVLVLAVGFASTFIAATSMLWDSWTNKQATYHELEDKIDAQNSKLDDLIEKLSTKK